MYTNGSRFCSAATDSIFSLALISSFGAIQITLPVLRIETFGLQNNVERLIPRYVLQAQCDGAVHWIDVMMLKLVKSAMTCSKKTELQYSENSGKLLTVIANALRQLGRIHFLGFNFHNELVIALIGTVNPQAFRLYHHANPVTRLECCDRLHRGTKIGNIQAPAEAFRERWIS